MLKRCANILALCLNHDLRTAEGFDYSPPIQYDQYFDMRDQVASDVVVICCPFNGIPNQHGGIEQRDSCFTMTNEVFVSLNVDNLRSPETTTHADDRWIVYFA